MLPAELQVGRRAGGPAAAGPRGRVGGEMDGCSRQDPAYRPAKGRAPERGLSYSRARAETLLRGRVGQENLHICVPGHNKGFDRAWSRRKDGDQGPDGIRYA